MAPCKSPCLSPDKSPRSSPRLASKQNPSAPNHSTRSGSIASVLRMLKAKKAQSLNKESQKKKSISNNLKRQISSKKRKASQPVPPPNEDEGLRLLKRGCVSMHRIVRRKINGVKLEVPFNCKGEPYGKAGAEMQSYIGVLARTKPPIWHDTWKQVPDDIKQKIWDCVQMAFIVPPTAKKMVMNSACSKWREFKCRLTRNYVLPYRDEPEKLKHPPADYSFIEKSHWDIFVADRLSEEFLKTHNDQKARRSMNPYPHRMSRKGYANLEKSWSESHPDEPDIDRSDSWVLARKDKEGNFVNDDVKNIALEIAKMKKLVSEGEITEEGTDDVLTKVLGKPEHSGRVRGQGSHVKPSVYFHLPNQKKAKTIDEKILEGVRNFMAVETPRIIQERDAFWAAEMAKLRAELVSKNSAGQRGSPINGSQEGSCSNARDRQPFVTNLTMHEPVKKKLDLETHKVVEDDGVEAEDGVEAKDGVQDDAVDVEPAKNLPFVTQVVSASHDCNLLVGSYVVAFGKMDEVPVVEGNEQTIHGVVLGKENARVSITRVVKGDAKIPFPIGDEILTVEQAVGTYIAWPRNLITSTGPRSPDGKRTKARARKHLKKKTKKLIDESDDNEDELVLQMCDGYPGALKRLWAWARTALADGRTVCVQLSEEIFGVRKKYCLFAEDIHALISSGEIAGSTICVHIMSLYEHVKKHKMADMIAFVDPGMIGALGCGSARDRSRSLAVRFKDANKGQYFLMPYNQVNHWSLTVVNPEAEVVYHMDPLKRRIPTGEWLDVVNNAIRLYKEDMKKTAKKKILWENMAGIPVQNGSTECGLFVMNYMKEICENKDLDFADKWMRRGNLVYTDDNITDLKVSWAKYFMKHHAV